MKDKNGLYSYSPTIAITHSLNGGFFIGPNPVADKIYLRHPVASSKAVIEVFSNDGRLLVRKKVVANAKQTSIDVSNIPAGAYRLVYTINNNKTTISFLKQ